MAKAKSPIPEGFHTVTPQLTLDNCADAIEWYKKGLGAQEVSRAVGPDGKIMHAEIKIGDSILFVSDECREVPNSCRAPETLKGTSAALFLYVPDVDAAFAQAVKAGGKVNMPLTDMFWGDRYGQLRDPFGHSWSIAHQLDPLSPEEIRRRAGRHFES